MLTALIFVISAVMLAQFAVCYWRVSIRKVAAQRVSPGLLEAGASIGLSALDTNFCEISAMSEICPAAGVSTPRLWGLRAYYSAMQLLAKLSSFDPLRNWAREEMVTCTRYLAVQVELRFRQNQALLCEIRSY